jgi:hypothetical protein
MNSELINLFDNNHDLIHLEYKGKRVWPFIRYLFYMNLINANNNIQTPKGEKSLKLTIFFNFFTTLLYSRKKSSKNIFFTSSRSLIKQDEVYTSKLFYRYYDLFKDNHIIYEENKVDTNIINRRKNIYTLDPILFITNIQSKFLSIFHSKKESDLNKCVNTFLEIVENINIKPSVNNKNLLNRKQISRILIYMNYLHKNLNFYFKKFNPKLVFIEDGHYGMEKSVIIYLFHKKLAKIIEPQHGFVNKNHPAYYFGQNFTNDKEIKKYYPDTFNTYGNFWSNNIKLPNDIHEIGNPFLEDKLSNYINTKSKKIILIIGSGIAPFEMSQYMNYLLKNNREHKIYFRPHPVEKFSHSSDYKDQYDLGMLIDDKELYYSLSTSDIILSELSTVLFESINFCKRVYLLNTSYTKTYFNDSILYFHKIDFENINDIFDLDYKISNNSINYYWTFNYKNNLNILFNE